MSAPIAARAAAAAAAAALLLAMAAAPVRSAAAEAEAEAGGQEEGGDGKSIRETKAPCFKWQKSAFAKQKYIFVKNVVMQMFFSFDNFRRGHFRVCLALPSVALISWAS